MFCFADYWTFDFNYMLLSYIEPELFQLQIYGVGFQLQLRSAPFCCNLTWRFTSLSLSGTFFKRLSQHSSLHGFDSNQTKKKHFLLFLIRVNLKITLWRHEVFFGWHLWPRVWPVLRACDFLRHHRHLRSSRRTRNRARTDPQTRMVPRRPWPSPYPARLTINWLQ